MRPLSRGDREHGATPSRLDRALENEKDNDPSAPRRRA